MVIMYRKRVLVQDNSTVLVGEGSDGKEVMIRLIIQTRSYQRNPKLCYSIFISQGIRIIVQNWVIHKENHG